MYTGNAVLRLMGQSSGENLSESVDFAGVDQSWKTKDT